MLKITIIGHGFVGKAVDYAFQDDVEKQIIDPKYDVHLHDVGIESDITFICVPTPMHKHGQCDVSILEAVINNIKQRMAGLIVIKSTVPPDQIENLFRGCAKHRMIYNPEFLTEKNANNDFLNQERFVLGGELNNVQKVSDIYKLKFGQSINIIETDFESAELIKYVANTFLASKVSFMNEMKILSNKINANWDDVLTGVTLDSRIGSSHVDVPGHDGKLGFGGSCFPKDIQALIHFSKSLGIELHVLQAAWKTNLEVRPEKDWELLDGRAITKRKKT